MKVGCMMHNFPRTSLKDVCGIIKDIGSDIGMCPKGRISGNPVEQKKKIESYGLEISGLSVHST